VTRYEDLDPWALLEVSPGASAEEIRRAYERLSSVLSPGSLALYSVADAEEQRRLQRALYVAYMRLLRAATNDDQHPPAITPRAATVRLAQPPRHAEPNARPSAPTPPTAPAPEAPAVDADTEITGLLLRQLRESRRLSLDEVATRTRIRRAHIESIELEDFNALPERVFTRGFVLAYSRELGVDPERAWNCIEARFLRARPPQELKL
jgi:flagellar biosynthesis protein FlhG